MTGLDADRLAPGQRHTTVLVDGLTRTQIVQYAGASGDYNPLHTDEVFATQVAGQPTVMAHGMLTMGMTAKALTDLVGDGTLIVYGARFQRPVWPGDTLIATVDVVGLSREAGDEFVQLAVTTTNQHGDTVLSGAATARVPNTKPTSDAPGQPNRR